MRYFPVIHTQLLQKALVRSRGPDTLSPLKQQLSRTEPKIKDHIAQWDYWGWANQKWTFVPAN